MAPGVTWFGGQFPGEVMGLKGSVPPLGFLFGEEEAIPWDKGWVWCCGGPVPT